jgi:hypothetical protein
MNKYSKISKGLVLWTLLVSGFVNLSQAIAFGQTFYADSRNRLNIKVSKMGLNRISNPPYRIVQVTGDDSSFRLKYDEDGENIYLMPMKGVGEKIEIALKNNAGFVQDLELEVENIAGQTIVIDGAGIKKTNAKEKKQNLQSMLKAMKDGKIDKFYVQNLKKNFSRSETDGLEIVQTKIYKWQNLAGSVFVVSNKTRQPRKFDLSAFVKDFDNVLTYVASNPELKPKESVEVFVIQEIKE